ncbi:hypothetical protein CARUB_v10018928mg, partial [Capsella rubella]
QLLYETCLCVWLLSNYEPAIEYLATSRKMQRFTEVVKSSTKISVSQYTKNFASFICFRIFHFHKLCVVILTFRNLLPKCTFGAQMVDLGLPRVIHSLQTQAWSDESVTSFEENDFQILRILPTILDSSSDPRSLAVACFDLSQSYCTTQRGE